MAYLNLCKIDTKASNYKFNKIDVMIVGMAILASKNT